MAELLLVGNGPNYIREDGTPGISWHDVIRSVARHARLANQTESMIKAPLPLVYDTIASRYPKKERDARIDLANRMRNMKTNGVHKELMSLGFRNVLTTNYDHCLEGALDVRFLADNLASETTYSLFRRKTADNRAVWHIHGDISGPRTMLLGMHNYCGHVQKIRAYLTEPHRSPFIAGTKGAQMEAAQHSWADLFLRDNVHIVGHGLDYSEIALWWLIGFKLRVKQKRGLPCGSTTYYCPDHADDLQKQKIKMLLAYDVKIIPIPANRGVPTAESWRAIVNKIRAILLRSA